MDMEWWSMEMALSQVETGRKEENMDISAK